MSESMEATQSKFVARMLPEARASEGALVPVGYRPQQEVRDTEVITLVHQIYLKERAVPLRTVIFSGLQHGVGCTRMSAAAAMVLARSTGSVCLVESNFHTPSTASVFGVQKRSGLSDALLEEQPIDAYVQKLGNGLSLMQAGTVTGKTSLVLSPDRVKDRLAELQEEFRYVIIDAAPLSYVETLMLSHLSSGVVMVLEANKTRRDEASSAADTLRASGIEILGAVLNKMPGMPKTA